MIGYGFKQLAIPRIYVETLTDNLGAVRQCEHFGMRQEAHFIHNRYFKKRWWDTVVYAVLADEWENRTKRQF